MGKIVKYCNSCDEGFGERFTFCPDCGASLQAFEMNPLTGEPVAAEEVSAPATPSFIAETPVEETIEAPAAFAELPIAEEPISDGHVDLEYDDAKYDYLDVEEETPAFAASAAPVIDDGYHITVIEEKNVGQRNGLLLAASVFMIVFVMSATVYSLFSKALGVGAIDEGMSLASIIDNVPMPVDEPEMKKDKDKSGGGGGSGQQEKDPASLGDLADQTKNPLRPPDAKIPRFDSELVLPPASSQGDQKFEKKYNRYGLPNGLDALSNGPGTGGGIGSGNGLGQGTGNGSGAGSGNGSGYGSGNGNGNGPGSGDGSSSGPPPDIIRVTSPYKIIAKPKATYTDAARTNNIQGSVTLKIVLLASGQVGSITPVTRLPYGLTEQAIAAARQIRFEPKKVNGVATSTTVTFQYGFNIY